MNPLNLDLSFFLFHLKEIIIIGYFLNFISIILIIIFTLIDIYKMGIFEFKRTFERIKKLEKENKTNKNGFLKSIHTFSLLIPFYSAFEFHLIAINMIEKDIPFIKAYELILLSELK